MSELRELIGYNAVPHINCNKPFYWAEDVDRAFTKLLTELETLRARVREAEEVIRPFATAYNFFGNGNNARVHSDELRKARAFMGGNDE